MHNDHTLSIGCCTDAGLGRSLLWNKIEFQIANIIRRILGRIGGRYIFTADLLEQFIPVYGYTGRSADPESDTISSYFHNSNLDSIAEDYPLVDLS
jgi:hypothetical protein